MPFVVDASMAAGWVVADDIRPLVLRSQKGVIVRLADVATVERRDNSRRAAE